MGLSQKSLLSSVAKHPNTFVHLTANIGFASSTLASFDFFTFFCTVRYRHEFREYMGWGTGGGGKRDTGAVVAAL